VPVPGGRLLGVLSQAFVARSGDPGVRWPGGRGAETAVVSATRTTPPACSWAPEMMTGTS